MCTRCASERIEVRASLMSSLKISLSGPSSGLTERPIPDRFDVALADTWSAMSPPVSRLSLILPGILGRSLDGETIECHNAYRAGQAPRWLPTPTEADLDNGYEYPGPTGRGHRSSFRTRPDARADASAVPGRSRPSGSGIQRLSLIHI